MGQVDGRRPRSSSRRCRSRSSRARSTSSACGCSTSTRRSDGDDRGIAVSPPRALLGADAALAHPDLRLARRVLGTKVAPASESVRRYAKRLEKTYGDGARIEIFRTRDQIDRLFADSALIHRETYQHVLGVGFSDEKVQRALTELAMDRGWFRGYILYLNDAPAAFWHGAYKASSGSARPVSTRRLPTRGRVRTSSCARSRTWPLTGQWRPSTSASATRSTSGISGTSAGRRRTSSSWSGARPLALNLARTGLQGTTKVARGAVERVGGLGRLRRRRRERLAEKAKQ